MVSNNVKKVIGVFLIILAIILFIVAPVQREKDPDNMTYGGMVTLVIIGVICFIVGAILLIMFSKNSNTPLGIDETNEEFDARVAKRIQNEKRRLNEITSSEHRQIEERRKRIEQENKNREKQIANAQRKFEKDRNAGLLV